MAKVIGSINGIMFTGTREECNEWIAKAEQEAALNYPDVDENDLEDYWVKE